MSRKARKERRAQIRDMAGLEFLLEPQRAKGIEEILEELPQPPPLPVWWKDWLYAFYVWGTCALIFAIAVYLL